MIVFLHNFFTYFKFSIYLFFFFFNPERATSNQNQSPDTAAIDAFCGLVNREPESAQMAARFITAKVHSLQEWEALQALHVS